MDSSKKGGDDEVEPPMICHLPGKGMEWLLDIFNESWSTGQIPGKWRHAVIIPLLKAGKSAYAVDSYRPISLTSVLAKCLERTVAQLLARGEQNSAAVAAGFPKTEVHRAAMLKAVTGYLRRISTEANVQVCSSVPGLQ